jgi:hypothetical protein
MTQPARPSGDDSFSPCTWDEVRLAQARRFARWTPDEKLAWLTGMLELFPRVLEAARQRALERAPRF